MKRFNLTETQAESILELKLRHLAKLEEMRIRVEQEELAKERDELEKILGSTRRLKTLIRKEILADAETYGDDRNSPLVERQEAQAMREEQIIPSEPITIVLSQKGWVRAAKGFDADLSKLNYKSGDSFLQSANGRTNQAVIFLDSTGRSYSVPGHTLPSARGQGDPLTGKLKPKPGASFVTALADADDQLYLLASSAGYGFVTKLENLQTKNRAGKGMLTLPACSSVLTPRKVSDVDTQYIAAVSSGGRLLLFPIAVLPELPRGKGNKIMNIPSAKVKDGSELMVAVAVLNENESLVLYSGKRHLTLKPKDLAYYQGERGRRGNMLPRGFRRVDRIESGD